jgi:hypothetical protein
LSTLCTALDLKHVTGFPGLASKLVRKYPPQSVATAMGHMDQSRKNLRSTKPKFSPPPTDETATDTFPTSPPSGKRTHHVYVAVTNPDQTGRSFPTKRVASSFLPALAAPKSSFYTTTTQIILLPSP